jgi:nucleoside-diphosphate-sugar epimerase
MGLIGRRGRSKWSGWCPVKAEAADGKPPRFSYAFFFIELLLVEDPSKPSSVCSDALSIAPSFFHSFLFLCFDDFFFFRPWSERGTRVNVCIIMRKHRQQCPPFIKFLCTKPGFAILSLRFFFFCFFELLKGRSENVHRTCLCHRGQWVPWWPMGSLVVILWNTFSRKELRSTQRCGIHKERRISSTGDLGTTYKDKAVLKLFRGDLELPGSYDEATVGCEVVVHTAARVLFNFKKDPFKEIINPSVAGVENIVSSCIKNKVRRIVFTSSDSTIVRSEGKRTAERKGTKFTEEDWNTDLATPTHGTYNYMKIQSELKMNELWKGELISLIPTLVLGPQQNDQVTSSQQVIAALVNREYPMAPRIFSDWIDVRDAARAHVYAATTPITTLPSGRYNICNGEVKSALDYSLALNRADPTLNAPTKMMPKAVLWLASWIDARVTSWFLSELAEKMCPNDNSKFIRHGFQYRFTNVDETMKDALKSFREHGLVKKEKAAKR